MHKWHIPKILLVASIITLLLVSLTLFVFLGRENSTSKNENDFSQEYVSGEAVIKVTDESLSVESLENDLSKYQVIEVSKINTSLEGYYLIRFKKGVDLKNALIQINNIDYIDSAEPNFISEVND